jgi:hypothetical protein
MQSRRLSISIPEPVLDALYAEGSRTYETPGQVAARVLREALPDYVEGRLRKDLAPVIRARVVDVRTGPIRKLGPARSDSDLLEPESGADASPA